MPESAIAEEVRAMDLFSAIQLFGKTVGFFNKNSLDGYTLLVASYKDSPGLYVVVAAETDSMVLREGSAIVAFKNAFCVTEDGHISEESRGLWTNLSSKCLWVWGHP